MSLAGGAIAAMQRAYKANRDLGKTKRTPHDQGLKSTKNGSDPLVYNKMTAEEYQVFKLKLKSKKRKSLIKMAIVYGVMISATIYLFVWFLM